MRFSTTLFPILAAASAVVAAPLAINNGEASLLAARNADDAALNARFFDDVDDELTARWYDDDMELEARDWDEYELEARGPPAKKPAAKAPAAKKPCTKKKRANGGPVEGAWRAKGSKIGGGAKGSVYHTVWNGQPAVLKEIAGPAAANAQREANNLQAVGQLFGWGRAAGGEGAAVIIMKNMGDADPKKGGVTDAAKARTDAIARYKTTFHMENKDANEPNFVYKGGKAEIIDWDRGVWSGKGAQPTAPAPEILDISNADNCVSM